MELDRLDLDFHREVATWDLLDGENWQLRSPLGPDLLDVFGYGVVPVDVQLPYSL